MPITSKRTTPLRNNKRMRDARARLRVHPSKSTFPFSFFFTFALTLLRTMFIDACSCFFLGREERIFHFSHALRFILRSRSTCDHVFYSLHHADRWRCKNVLPKIERTELMSEFPSKIRDEVVTLSLKSFEHPLFSG